MERRNFNIVFQDYALFPNLNAIKNIRYGLKNYPERSTEEEVDSLIDLLDLREHLNKKNRHAFRRSETARSPRKNSCDEA